MKKVLQILALCLVGTLTPAFAQTTNWTTSLTSTAVLRNNFTGFVGTQFTVGGTALPVSSLGRMCIAGNNQAHTVQIFNTSFVSVATASVSMAGCTAGHFAYASVGANPVTLAAGTHYYLVSSETGGGDQWYEWNGTTVQVTSAASIVNAAWGYSTPLTDLGMGQEYVGLDFQYCLSNCGGGTSGSGAPGTPVAIIVAGFSSAAQVALQNGTLQISVSVGGTVSTPVVSLAWVPSISNGVTGYNVKRGTVNGGPYTTLNSTPISTSALSYQDTTATSGMTYYYVVTAVTNGVESGNSNQATVPIP